MESSTLLYITLNPIHLRVKDSDGKETIFKWLCSIKNKLTVSAVGRKVRDIVDGIELREPEFSYNVLFEAKKEDMGQNRGPDWG